MGVNVLCELLGMCFNQEVQPSFSLRGFRMRSERNPHGWGLAFYPDKSVQVYKEPVKSRKSIMAEIMEGYNLIRSSIIMSHVRTKSSGEISHKDTHPSRGSGTVENMYSPTMAP
ncbi:class II glutamine amidotransferase [Methanothermobacter thermautotrophicus]|nr:MULTISPECIES: class II glutamine amidotransferase [Methanothermobacter]WBF05976.1 class II glutamine amidotransferase [Methanothermobacter thermautotrophicus]WBF07768.1 class II glutamine amidotransferase [Methanothermobacter thermautotrophicus]HIH71417.1 class II glutamine amidotransferase [Methanothermobacter thermautotrophicus]HOQ18914.1 class II glutamine amidotransferase [Methanothermobacter thermautotrophicus]